MIIVIGLLAVAGSALYKYQQLYFKSQHNAEILQTAQQSVQNYLNQHGQLPCPASRTANVDTAWYGISMGTNCSTAPVNPDGTAPSGTIRVPGDVDGTRMVRIGTLPVRTLGLADADMMDAWGNRLMYAVTEDMASPGFAWGQKQGAISVNDANANAVTAKAGNIAFAILSYGKDSRGAFNFEGTQPLACGAGLASENCNDTNATFVNTSQKSYNIDGAGGNNSFTYSMNFMVNPVPDVIASATVTHWSDLGWTDCSVVCGTGTRTRIVQCIDATGHVVGDAYCTSAGLGPPPSGSQTCSATCSWDVGTFGACNNTCGDGQQNRNVACKDSYGSVIANEYCAATDPRPTDTQTCHDEGGCHYAWVADQTWDECTDKCAGTQIRNVYCVKLIDNSHVSDRYCAEAGDKPSTSQTCGDTTLPECNLTCAPGP